MITWPQLLCELQRDWSRKQTVPSFMNLFIETGEAPLFLRDRPHPRVEGR